LEKWQQVPPYENAIRLFLNCIERKHSVAGIITSPPYLCMADYALGLRLSYQWIAPSALATDFENELGARRERGDPEAASTAYFQGMRSFARLAAKMLRPGGSLSVVLGEPKARSFASLHVFREFDKILAEEGFEPLWARDRQISWHRNHAYARLKSERISVHIRQ